MKKSRLAEVDIFFLQVFALEVREVWKFLWDYDV